MNDYKSVWTQALRHKGWWTHMHEGLVAQGLLNIKERGLGGTGG